MPVKIYKLDVSPPARAVLMTAEILKLKCELIDVDVAGGAHLAPEFVEKNPAHTIPFLEDGDFQLSDSHAIITYLVSKYGAEQRAKLYPCELSLRATIDQRLYFDTSILFIAVKRVSHAYMSQGAQDVTEPIKEVHAAYEIIEKYLEKTKYVACNHLTIADISCVASISSLATLVPIDEKYPKLNAWLDLLREEDWYKKANLPGVQILEQFAKSLKN